MTTPLKDLIADPSLGLSSYFGPPSPDPPAGPLPYSGRDPVIGGELDPAMEGRPLKDLCVKVTGLGEEEACELIRFGAMWLNARQAPDPTRKLPGQGSFRLNYPPYGPVKFFETDPARVVFEDDYLLVYDKESGRPTQPTPYDCHNDVLSGLDRMTRQQLRLPHRLDVGTSGLLIAVKERRAAGVLGKAFQEGRVRKRYVALNSGPAPDWDETVSEATIAKNDGRYIARANGPGLAAKTSFKVLARAPGRTLFLAVPHTGRTHQIRLHLAFLGFPILGDKTYGGQKAKRVMLKASGVAFKHPVTGKPLVLGEPWEDSDLEGL
jgi:23S rRNA pseudouridine1911/1915/1917 synthase